MLDVSSDRVVVRLIRQQAALAAFGSFAFLKPNLITMLTEAARLCAAALEVPFCKVFQYRDTEDDLLSVAGWGWHLSVIGQVASQADESSLQGQAYVTGNPVIVHNLQAASDFVVPSVYEDHGIVSTVNVIISASGGAPYGVLEISSTRQHHHDEHDINFLTSFANLLAETIATATRVTALLDALNAKNLLARDLHHRVRYDPQTIIGMLDNYARRMTSDTAQGAIDMILRRVTTLAQVYDSLLSVGLSGTVDLAEYLGALCATLPTAQAEHVCAVNILCQAEPIMLGVEEVSTLGMVVAELVANSYDHAFPDRGGTITVRLVRNSPTNATLTVEDDGVGFPARAQVGLPRNGLALVARLMDRVGGTSDEHFNAGTVWDLRFPVPAMLSKIKITA